tara:strand:- start:201 stop:629 length:429 start_codon:yes stop_codon:yes gene_type:complete
MPRLERLVTNSAACTDGLINSHCNFEVIEGNIWFPEADFKFKEGIGIVDLSDMDNQDEVNKAGVRSLKYRLCRDVIRGMVKEHGENAWSSTLCCPNAYDTLNDMHTYTTILINTFGTHLRGNINTFFRKQLLNNQLPEEDFV